MRMIFALVVMAACSDSGGAGPDAELHFGWHDQSAIHCDPAWKAKVCEFACAVRPVDDFRLAVDGVPFSDPRRACTGATNPTFDSVDCPSAFALPDGTIGCCLERLVLPWYPLKVPTFYECPVVP